MSRRKHIVRSGWAIYLRTSNQEAQNPANSQERQRFTIKRNLIDPSEMTVIEEYVDNLSGRSASNRPDYQRLLQDARAGKFSHVAVENAERFGRNDTEALVAIDELHNLGVAIRFADYPDLDPIDPDDRIMVCLSFTLARRESIKLGQRVRGGLFAKLRSGGCATLAPDGYVNREIRTSDGDKLSQGRYTRWVEQDPERAHIWREAWDLLLEDRYTLEQICETLHTRGYTYRSGRPFIDVRKEGHRRVNKNTLSKIFHNWFYAGWVRSKKAGIMPKTVRGLWEPIVTTEEFEQGLAILSRRNAHKIAKRKHTYLLKSLVYLQLPNHKKPKKLVGSTPNSGRSGGGTAYYCVPSSGYNIPCHIVDSQLPLLLRDIQVDPQHMPEIRRCYQEEIAERLGHNNPEHHAEVERLLQAVDDEEHRAARLFTMGKISDRVWEGLWAEWQDRRARLQESLVSLSTQMETHIHNLDKALEIISQIGILYAKLEEEDQQQLLRLIVERIIVDPDGKITKLILRSPFAYLTAVAHQVPGEVENRKTSQQTARSMCVSSCGPEELRSVN